MENLYQSILDNLYEGIYLINESRVVTYWNESAERITGFKAREIIGKYCNDSVLNHTDSENARLRTAGCPVHRTLLDGKRREANVYLHHRDGQRVEVSVITLPLYDCGKIIGAAEVFTESHQKTAAGKAPSQSEDVSLSDPLTELPNKRYVDFYLNNRLNEFEKLGISFSVIMADIDNFKQLNDACGLDVGDQVLKMIAKTMRSAFRKNDFIGRWGGDQFIVIIIGVSEEDLGYICEKIRNLVKNSTLRTKREPISVTISIGSTVVCAGDTAESIQTRTNCAVDSSKQAGKDMVTIL